MWMTMCPAFHEDFSDEARLLNEAEREQNIFMERLKGGSKGAHQIGDP
jgi:hypothetical protein